MSTTVLVQPLQWSSLLHIDDVRPIDDTDGDCLQEIRDVLDKHGCLDRFGVALLHSHFQIDETELLLETTDVARREHWVRPVSRKGLAEAGLTAQTTVVRFDDTGFSQACACSHDNSGHTGGHVSVPG
jgi:hypothetical protein